MDKINILITGGAGFIPSSLSDRLSKNTKYLIVCVDNMLTGKQNNITQSETVTFIKCDVNNFDEISQIMTAYKFDYVFHYAAFVGVKKTTDNPIMVLNDIKGIENILTLSKNTGVKRVFYSSSSEVYGEPVHLPQHEVTTPLNSKLPYAIVKNIGEAYCRSYHQEYGLDYTIFRFFNTYGPKQSTDFVISKFISSALKGEDITIYGDGLQTRTFCHIDDNIDVTVKCLEENLFVNSVINVGSDAIKTIKELAELVIEKTGSLSKIINLPPLKEGDMTRRQPDIQNMLNILNLPLIPLEKGLNSLLKNE